VGGSLSQNFGFLSAHRSAATAMSPSSTVVRSDAPSSQLPTSSSPAVDIAPTGFADWERIDLPDPAPRVYGGGTPVDVVKFKGGYVAVGTVNAQCCADGDPSLNRGVAWTSPDGRTWKLLDGIEAFAHASLRNLLSDGTRLYAFGSSETPEALNSLSNGLAMWTSADGLNWEQSGTPVLDAVATSDGLIGFSHDDDAQASGLWFSPDGVTWALSTSVIGTVNSIVANPEGGAVAVGTVTLPAPPGEVAATVVIVWRTVDGRTWTAAESVADGRGLAVALDSSHRVYVAGIGTDQRANGEVTEASAIWTSPDALRWDRHPIGAVDVDLVKALWSTEGALIAEGDSAIDGTSNATVWISTDGNLWNRVRDSDAFSGTDNSFRSLVDTDSGVLAVGSRWDTASGHVVPVVWLADR
jgi:hypothetical protein